MSTPDENRPDPDALLAAVTHEEARLKRGKLKIFFGMAAGVGKTYGMLQAARERKTEGIDVVVGVVETHKRAETEALLQGLTILPRKTIDYRGTTLQEMDISAILSRRPQLVLVDELAHNLGQSPLFVEKSVVIERPPSATTREVTFTFTIRARLVKAVNTIPN